MAWTQIIGPLADADHNHDLDYEAIGAAATAVGDHESAVNPHPTYLTQAEGDALYSGVAHDHDADYAPIIHQHLVVANSQIGTTYTLALGDAEETIEFDNALAITLTVPTNAVAAFPVGTTIELIQVGSGQVTVVGSGGVTVDARIGLKLAGQWAVAKLVKRATNTWILSGDLAA
jgi:hypothetical protein